MNWLIKLRTKLDDFFFFFGFKSRMQEFLNATTKTQILFDIDVL